MIQRPFVHNMHSIVPVHWNNKTERAQRRPCVSPAQRESASGNANLPSALPTGACGTPPYPAVHGEPPFVFFRMHWDLEPMAIPLTRPSDTLSPSGGEG